MININEGTGKIMCNNCGKEGHTFYQCKLPIISCGIVLCNINKNNEIEYLMNRRKNSYGFIDMIRGKYNPNDLTQVMSLIEQMSEDEKAALLLQDFDNLWKEMWNGDYNYHTQNEYNISLKRFSIITQSNEDGGCALHSLQNMINNCKNQWQETEWEFPKGRRNNIKERDIDCAIREFEEETGIDNNNFELIENIINFEETFIGTNGKSYKNKYFIAIVINDSISLDNYQFNEVSKLEWKTYTKCTRSIRPDNLEKKELITHINNVLQQFRLYS